MKKIQKILTLMVGACMVMMLGAISAYADDSTPDTKWDDYAAADFAGGTGTKIDPYLIETPQQLAKVSKDVAARETYKGAYFRLTADIDLSGHRWIPIGDYGGITYNSFEGFFDGNGKTITGMVVDQGKDHLSAGLFGHISNANAANEVGVKNLIISGAALYLDESAVTGPAADISAGILCAGAMINDGCEGTGTFENIDVSGTINVAATDGSNKIGGLFGDDNRTKVRSCNANVTISGSSNTGGMAGISCGSTYENCTAKGKISGLWALGGFVGYATSSTWDDKTTESTFSHCITNVEIEASNWNAGGFAGFAEFGTFKNCASLGKVASTVEGFEPRVGGFVGCAGTTEYLENSNATFANCHSASLVAGSDASIPAGGFAGKLVMGSFADCSFDHEKNASLDSTGQTEQPGQQASACSTQRTLSNICVDVYGGHAYAEDFTVDRQPTCTEEGWQSRHCTRCDEPGEGVIIPKTDHVWGSTYTVDRPATCTEDGSRSIHCTVCDAKKDVQAINATGHALTWVIDQEPTATEDGWKHQACEKGDYEGERVRIPATGAAEPSQPSDGTTGGTAGGATGGAAGGAADGATSGASDGAQSSSGDKASALPQTSDAAGAVAACAVAALVAGAAFLAMSARKTKSRR